LRQYSKTINLQVKRNKYSNLINVKLDLEDKFLDKYLIKFRHHLEGKQLNLFETSNYENRKTTNYEYDHYFH
jgi:hypothetical protein